MQVYAQGDVLLVRIDDVELRPEKIVAPVAGAVVLAEGEHTGHRHAFYGGATLFRDDALAGGMPLELYIGHVKIAAGGAVLEHGNGPGLKGDHDPVELPAGTYVARRQRQYAGGRPHIRDTVVFHHGIEFRSVED
jgi:hypothetical protein